MNIQLASISTPLSRIALRPMASAEAPVNGLTSVEPNGLKIASTSYPAGAGPWDVKRENQLEHPSRVSRGRSRRPTPSSIVSTSGARNRFSTVKVGSIFSAGARGCGTAPLAAQSSGRRPINDRGQRRHVAARWSSRHRWPFSSRATRHGSTLGHVRKRVVRPLVRLVLVTRRARFGTPYVPTWPAK